MRFMSGPVVCEMHRHEYWRKGIDGMQMIIPSYIMDDGESIFTVTEFKKILASGHVDLDAPCPMGYRTIHCICGHQSEDAPVLLKLLLEYQPRLVNSRAASITETPLMAACAYGRKEMVKILLEYQADPFAIDYAGRTPEDYAKQCCQYMAKESMIQQLKNAKKNW
eukprot:CAMPEP_0206192242 /NCGR_PEP_ID=MMETSP0166-20121206/5840_1 /ASSEMBLY_ACC=CAM_ASM_000260 /TAXON_ID=95228 /ORGANISM="Vannella robusta, Strain DIVA3 518/3/11/1/6" /LENGTH=165 /DNA_ID=CAMNT_0053608697 /DNA_START=1182 /DNA_END=1676 /DNA_ORIENTATION=-